MELIYSKLLKNDAMQKYASFLLILTLLVLPLSSTAKSVCFSLAISSILLTPSYRADLIKVFQTPWCRAGLILFLIALIACLWSPADWTDKKFSIGKYSKLLFLPLLAVGFQEAKTRNWGLHAFLTAMLITSLLSIFKYHGYLELFNFDPDKVFRNHIITGFLGAFAVYLFFLFAHRSKQFSSKAIYLLLGLIESYHVLFVNGGRTGYLIYFVVISILVLQLCSWKIACLSLILIPFGLTAVYFYSPVMNQRLNAIWQEAQTYQQEKKDTDLGYRLQFHQYAYSLFKQSPLLGNGTGSFTYYYEQEKPVPSWSWKLIEPHSQYWLVASEFGLLGLFFLFVFFWQLIGASFQLDQTKAIAFALLIPFFIGNLSDSLLFYSGPGYFFILLIALCMGELLFLSKSKSYSRLK